ncbi:MAG TPA: nitroreductase family protein [Candidatus Hydrogenedentes bacterium]|nr:nitroreductase family protein [Candidatus Hydrogenedentota bacterium]HPG67799.1 nitroreductase family protein [Candidatus Hydrogenedentota bacterium]
MDAIEALKTRRSVRSFLNKPVPREVIEDLVDCARLAASARNVQPWEFVVVEDAGRRAEIAEKSLTGLFIREAPVCVVVLCQDTKYYIEDGSAATQNLLVAARAHGLGTCWVAGDKKPHAEEIRRLVGAPDGHKLLSLIAVGYSDQVPAPSKRALADVIHWERF